MSKAYFLAPTRDNPPNQAIFLGSIIKSPREPELSINGPKAAFLRDLNVVTSSIPGASRTLFKTSSGKAGIWAEFIDGVGIGGKVGANWDDGEMAVYRFDELVTQTISPSFAEITDAFNETPVQQAIKDSRFKDNIYMITGIKIAKGADVAISKVRARGRNFQLGLDTTAAGAPLKFGPDIEINSGRGQTLTEKHTQAFVFAYRLREISYKKKKVKDQKELLKGDLMGDSLKRDKSTEAVDESKYVPELAEFREEATTLMNFDVDPAVAVDDDGSKATIISFENDEDQDEDDE